ncbi:MAG: glutaminyl-peptide cyclotransferase [Acidobacteria bacterium]|nr:glutaminyl-peptide cyclotransferase [Acidobacteriota bacterium]
MRTLTGFLLLLALAPGSPACGGGAASNGPNANGAPANAPQTKTNANAAAQVSVYGYEVVGTFPHDPAAFTQGLVFHGGALLESTGQYGESTLRRVELKTGKVLERVEVGEQFFAEGLALMNGKLYQLTWQNKRGFVYDPQTFEKTGEFAYEGEGWGLTHDGESLILSDGSDQLRFIDPNTFQVRRVISVNDRGRAVGQLNELEYVKGEIYANVWHLNRVARIDPKSGRVVGWVDLTGLLKPGETSDPEAVLNGIAYDERGDRLFVTGKLWPKVFEVRLRQK